MTRYLIDDDRYGIESEFASLEEAQEALGGMFPGTVLRLTEHGTTITDETGARIGRVEED